MHSNKCTYPVTSKRLSTSRFQRGLCALTITLLALLSAAFYQIPHVHAAGTTQPVIHWDGAMIYPGQNKGNPEGPVGEIAVVHGENFTATAGQPLKLMLVAGDTNNDATLCQAANTPVNVGNITPSADGTFSSQFTWPSAAGQVNKTYSICSLLASNNTVASSLDDGPFTVLAGQPTLKISASSVVAGGTLTISGQNWVPPQPLDIDIADCPDCDPGNSTIATATTNSVGLNSGTFHITVPILATAAPGNYVVNVFSQNGPLDAFHLTGTGVRQLVVTAPPVAATPTVAPSPSPAATATANATPTVTANPTSNTSNSSSGSNTGLFIGVLIAIVVLLIAIAGLIFYMLAQRKKQQEPPSPPSGYPGARPMNQYSASGGPMTPFPPGPGQPMNQPGQQSFANRNCVRCGSVLAPNSAICGRCGLPNTSMSVSDPNGPTIAY